LTGFELTEIPTLQLTGPLTGPEKLKLVPVPAARAPLTRALAVIALVAGAGIAGAIAIAMSTARSSLPTAVKHHAVAARVSSSHRAARAIAHAGAPPPLPSVGAMSRAASYLQARAGRTAFAVVDSRGREYGYNEHEPYVSASVGKAMLLVAYLRELAEQKEEVGSLSQALLYPMIHVSAVFARVGDTGMEHVADAAGMKEFGLGHDWANESITAADQARFFYRMDGLIPRQFRNYAKQLLSGIDPTESWGIPPAARPRWTVYFKGGWRLTGEGQEVMQIGRLEQPGRRLAIAVMTAADPSMWYGEQTIQGVTARLLGTS